MAPKSARGGKIGARTLYKLSLGWVLTTTCKRRAFDLVKTIQSVERSSILWFLEARKSHEKSSPNGFQKSWFLVQKATCMGLWGSTWFYLWRFSAMSNKTMIFGRLRDAQPTSNKLLQSKLGSVYGVNGCILMLARVLGAAARATRKQIQ